MNFGLIGYGKMGKEIETILLDRNHEVGLIIDKENFIDLNENNIQALDAVFEFTYAGAAIENYYTCFKNQVPVISGTTGWLEHWDEVAENCRKWNGGFFYASNFSVGVNVFFQINKHLAAIMNDYQEYDIAMEEIHHIHKKDAPSGTAISLAKDIIDLVDRKISWCSTKRHDTDIPIHAIREDEVPGTHTVMYESEIDQIEIKHIAKNRKGFAFGAVLAGEFMVNKKGVYGMSDLLNFNDRKRNK